MEHDDQMLLCDTCNHGYHMFCLSPPLTCIPDGDWNCPKCTLSSSKSSISSSSSSLTSSVDTISPIPSPRCSKSPLVNQAAFSATTSTTPTTSKRLSSSALLPVKCKHSEHHLFIHSLPSKRDEVLNTPRSIISAAKKLTSFMISSSPANLTLSTLKRMGTSCVQCVIETGLLDGDLVKNRRPNTKIEDNPLFLDYYVENHSFEDPTSEEALTHRFDVILSAVSIAAQHVYDTKDGNLSNPPQIPAELLRTDDDEASSTDSKRGARKRKLDDVSPTTTTTTTTTQKRNGTPDSLCSDSEGSSSSSNNKEKLPKPRSWIFSFNPQTKDTEAMVQPNVRVEWQVRQHADTIKKGDQVYIWASGKNAGICGLATVVENPTPILHPSNLPSPINSSSSKNPNRTYKTTLQIITPLTSHIPKSVLSEDPDLSDLTILRAPVATNFRVTSDQARVLDKLFCQYRDESPDGTYFLTFFFGFFL